ncbi:hypothetical protein FNV43_RR25829 [Rhamnella rubrinervis]|uniref:Uncharacterized protein n=1 Tax=Rhamnella rubrinervis TaxID=2594499 RepID=A0A8K0DMW5_9ROSA|nr:hypothetical protein FNV43_RR25829 [Rhamnella rubrinervis]
MPPLYFPLRWESTGDQWWYASPIDWAAANGLYDLVKELLYLDTNLLIKLTSLRRIRRLETVWDDEEQFDDVAKCRSQVARNLLHECETKSGHNSLIRAGYGGWLLYTAASAGDKNFVKELVDRDPLLVYGEGEYGVTDIFYAAARSKNCEVFRLLLDLSVSPRCCLRSGGELAEQLGYITSGFKWEMMNRSAHASARGGTLEMLRNLLGDCSDVLAYKDAHGSTVLHTASGRGQVEVVKFLVSFSDILTSTDNEGNTALHVAAYRGYLPVVEVLIGSSPSLSTFSNDYGDTFLHMAVAGFRTPGFRRLDRQIELMNQLVCGKIVNMQDIINVRNNDGRTALHLAVIENIQCNLVELLMTVPSINMNVRDADGMTPLDLLKQRPRSPSSEILIKQLISAGGISNRQDCKTRSALVSHLKMQGIGSSPGTSFRIPDAEIFLYTGIENASDASFDKASVQFNTCSGELSRYDSTNSLNNKKPGSVNYAARRLKFLLRWSRRKDKKAAKNEPGDNDSLDPSTKMKYAAGLMHGVIKAKPHFAQSPSSPLSESSMSSPTFKTRMEKIPITVESVFSNEKKPHMNLKQNSFNKKMMNEYFCFGAQGLAVEDSISSKRPNQSYRHLVA